MAKNKSVKARKKKRFQKHVKEQRKKRFQKAFRQHFVNKKVLQ